MEEHMDGSFHERGLRLDRPFTDRVMLFECLEHILFESIDLRFGQLQHRFGMGE
jgi:hypothetical protein